MVEYAKTTGFHDEGLASLSAETVGGFSDAQFRYTFHNFFHPLVGELLSRLNSHSLSGILDPEWQHEQQRAFFGLSYHSTQDNRVSVTSFPEQFDLTENGPYANYNWELFFHIPLTVAIHLSKTQRFAEAQRWFHYIFDPTKPDRDDVQAIAYAADTNNRIHACAVTADGMLWHTVRGPDDKWQGPFQDVRAHIGDPGVVRAVACATDAGNSLHVCMATADGGLAHTIRSSDGEWQSSVQDVRAHIGDPGVVRAVACATDAGNSLHVCMATADGGLAHTIRFAPDGHWQPFGNVKEHSGDPGEVRAVACAPGAENSLHVCMATADGGLAHTIRFAPDGHWQPFEDVKEYPGDRRVVRAVACAPGAENSLHVCMATADGGLAHTIRFAPDGQWQPLVKKFSGDDGVMRAVACAPGAENSLHVCVATAAGRLAHTIRWAHGGDWKPFQRDAKYNRDPRQRFWNFLAFRQDSDSRQIDYLLALLSKQPKDLSPQDQQLRAYLLQGYAAILNKPFQPHAVARTRHLAYQYCVVMKYLDNLISWGDHLFQQDTVESINEATQRYVLAANLLGPRPQRIPPRGTVRPQTFAQLKACPHDALGNALVDLEGQFPFNLDPGPTTETGAGAGPLFGIGRALYFCIPRNDKMLGYWDTVGDRLFKIRHCMNITGVVRPMALFDPPIDPGMLVKAAAAGLDVSGVVSGVNQPIGPVRCATMIQKALELCGEVRSLGAALLSALEKGDAEHLALVRQRHDIQIQQMTQGVRFLQWKSTQEQTQSLLTSRATALDRLRYYARLLGLPADPHAVETLVLQRPTLTEENFDEIYAGLVTQYDKPLTLQPFPAATLPVATSPAAQSGAAGQGRLYLSRNEDTELNSLLPSARDTRLAASVTEAIATIMTLLPEMHIKLAFWGLGGAAKIFGGSKLSDAIKIAAEIQRTYSNWQQDQAGIAARTAGYERRADDWLLQYNLAAHELMQNGRQILASLLAEQIAHHEYLNIQQQITNAQEVDQILHDKFTNEELYLWMQGEISRLYYEYYRFAFDTARMAERTMKQELMRPDLDAQTFVKFNYWDGGRKGLLSGEALHLDVKRMELAYLDNNKRELELTRHISLHQLDPVALLTLKTTGSCVINIPEWLYDRDCPGHYMRRIKNVALSIPSVVGPYISLNCTLTLLNSSIRKSPIAGNDYTRQGTEDDRFIDYAGSMQSIVTSGASNDSGLFEANLRDERFLPFEGAGAISTWKLDLPKDYRPFDYMTISDVVLHMRYTARQGVDASKVKNALDTLFQQVDATNQALLFSLRHDFPTEWSVFVNNTTDADFTATIREDHFPYFTRGKTITITRFDLYGPNGANPPKHHTIGNQTSWEDATKALGANKKFAFNAKADPAGPGQILTRTTSTDAFLVIHYAMATT